MKVLVTLGMLGLTVNCHPQSGVVPEPGALAPAPGMQAYKLDSRPSDHALIRPGERVGFYCYASLAGKAPKAYMLLRDVRVLALGKPTRQPTWQRSFTIEVPTDVARDLAEVIPKVSGIGVFKMLPKEAEEAPRPCGVNPVLMEGLATTRRARP